MRSTIRGIICMVASFITAGVLCAGEYYVAQKDPNANDGNSGTKEAPWMTINAALPHLKSGDTLFVREGEYRESIYLRKASWGEYPHSRRGLVSRRIQGNA